MRANRSNNSFKAIAYAMAFLYSGFTFAGSALTNQDDSQSAQALHKIYFSKEDDFGGPLTKSSKQFNCTEKIYTVVELQNYPKGRHELSIVWNDPLDNAREHTKYEFFIHKPDTRIWAWLSLSRASGASMLKWLNPSAGLEEFVGPWKVQVRINNKKIDDGSFTVLC